jgi:hypothetical protein
MNPHPNATVAASGTGIGVLVVWAAGRAGVAISAEEGALAVGLLSTLALAVGRKGIRGIIGGLWRGDAPRP